MTPQGDLRDLAVAIIGTLGGNPAATSAIEVTDRIFYFLFPMALQENQGKHVHQIMGFDFVRKRKRCPSCNQTVNG